MTQSEINGLAIVVFALAWLGSLKAAYDWGYTHGHRRARGLFCSVVPGHSPGHPEKATEDSK